MRGLPRVKAIRPLDQRVNRFADRTMSSDYEKVGRQVVGGACSSRTHGHHRDFVNQTPALHVPAAQPNPVSGGTRPATNCGSDRPAAVHAVG
jgi:hypothetical protein